MQKRETIAVQKGNMRAYLAKAGWQEIGAWADEAISGATLNRPGIQALLAACGRREVDVVLADELDRLSRGQSHTAKVYERLQFLGIRLVTVAEGEITRLHVGMKGTMNAEQISATSRKTRDALADRHMKGLNAGWRAYGYELDFQLDARGDRIPGHLKVNASGSAHIVSIYEQYAMGRSAKGHRSRPLPSRRTRPTGRQMVGLHDQRQQEARHRRPQQPSLCRSPQASASDVPQGSGNRQATRLRDGRGSEEDCRSPASAHRERRAMGTGEGAPRADCMSARLRCDALLGQAMPEVPAYG
jgi:DNA invertase Pin-like site-specific DNA recombinase